MIKLSRLISDGMVIHKDKPFKVWGWGTPGAGIEAGMSKGGVPVTKHSATAVRSDGSFELTIELPPAGEGYELLVRQYSEGTENGSADTSAGLSSVNVYDVAVGLTYIMCGQSNAGFPMCRVRDTYPEEWDDPNDSKIRTFKVTEHYAFDHVEEDVLTGEWKAVSPETIDNWCAVGYFAAKKISRLTGLPVGVIDATQGGSPIEAWMDREWLKDYPDRLETADRYKDMKLVEAMEQANATEGSRWREELYKNDIGVINHWEKEKITAEWNPVKLPAFLWETKIGHTIGSVWLKREFYIGDSDGYDRFLSESGLIKDDVAFCGDTGIMAEDAGLWLGTMTDADITYVNGTEVGRIEYSYPPRRYMIPAGLLKEGLNEVCVRLVIEHGWGRITPHKLLAIFTGETVRYIDDNDDEKIRWRDGKDHPIIDLSGRWYCKIAATADEIPGYHFFCWDPTALYNGVLAPCLNYPVGAFMWYQGESNTDISKSQYYDLTVKQIEGLRKAAGDEDLPYILAKLPRYDLNKYEGGGDFDIMEDDGSKASVDQGDDEYARLKTEGWAYIQDTQDRLGALPGVFVVDAADLGEGFDLHPQDKKPLGERYADMILMARH